MQRPVQARVQAKKGRGCGGVESSIFIVILKSSLSTFFHIGLHFKLNDIYIYPGIYASFFLCCMRLRVRASGLEYATMLLLCSHSCCFINVRIFSTHHL